MGRDIAPVAQWEDRAAKVPTVTGGVLVIDGDGDWAFDTGAAPDGYAVVDGDGEIAADTAVSSGLRLAKSAGDVITY